MNEHYYYCELCNDRMALSDQKIHHLSKKHQNLLKKENHHLRSYTKRVSFTKPLYGVWR